MARGVRLYLVGSFVLVSLAGCGRGFFQSAEREPWRAEAEIACLKSGAVKESAELVRIDPISGPGVCGAEYPLKVAALGEAQRSVSALPMKHCGRPAERRQPAALADRAATPRPSPHIRRTSVRQPGYAAPERPDLVDGAGRRAARKTKSNCRPRARRRGGSRPGNGRILRRICARKPIRRATAPRRPIREPTQCGCSRLPRLGPAQGNPVAAFGPVAVKPTATLACPIVSVLDRWLADSVQPAAQRWFGARVVEIRQISAYSCRGMNGNPRAHISEHAFGNALDIAGLHAGRRPAASR